MVAELSVGVMMELSVGVITELPVGVMTELPVGVASETEVVETLNDTLDDSPGEALEEPLAETSVGRTNDVLVSGPIVELLGSPIVTDDEVNGESVPDELALAEEIRVEKEEETDSPGVSGSPVELLEPLSTVLKTLELVAVIVCKLRDGEGVVKSICPKVLVLEFAKRG
jgi:hypothetical protein